MGNVFIYTLSDPITNEVRYVGKTNDIKSRIKDHIKRSKGKKTHKDRWINSLINKDMRPVILILDEVEICDWIFWEKFYISLLKVWGFNLVNHTDGGDGGSFKQHSFETKQKMSETRKGKKRLPFTEEHKRNLSESAKKKIITKEHRENIKNSLKNRIMSPFTEEHKKNISKSKKGVLVSEEVKIKKRLTSPTVKKIICLDTNEVYYSISEASRVLNIPISTIVGVLKNRRKLAGGLKFEYYG
jgi:group I intron endonuclease